MKVTLLARMMVALLGLASIPAGAENCEKPVGRPFRMFNGLAYAGQPDLGAYGLQPIHIVDRGIWAPGKSRQDAPNPGLVKSYVTSLPKDGAPIVLDFEDFDLTRNAEARKVGLSALLRLSAAFRRAAPDRVVGFYGYLPLRDYWRSIEPTSGTKYRSWQRENDRVVPLTQSVDALFPSVYTFYADEEGWIRYAAAQICEARRLSAKPVYIFLWPDFASRTNEHPQSLSGRYWRRELDTAYQLADGIVIWGGWDLLLNKAQPWNPDADWWRETVNFINTLKRPHR